VITSAPIPAGPGNSDPNYTPLWQVSLVTWKSGATPHVLKSEEEALNAQSQGLVTIFKTNIVVNCPVIYTPDVPVGKGVPALTSSLKSQGVRPLALQICVKG
jgi:hypothetical protein